MPSAMDLLKLALTVAENSYDLFSIIETIRSDEAYPWPSGKAPWSLEQGGSGVPPLGLSLDVNRNGGNEYFVSGVNYGDNKKFVKNEEVNAVNVKKEENLQNSVAKIEEEYSENIANCEVKKAIKNEENYFVNVKKEKNLPNKIIKIEEYDENIDKSDNS